MQTLVRRARFATLLSQGECPMTKVELTARITREEWEAEKKEKKEKAVSMHVIGAGTEKHKSARKNGMLRMLRE
jgi:hypothetical protein